MNREELIKRIKETAYLEGDFTLRSGKKSKYYLDKYLFETCPDILKALGEEFAKYVTDDVTLIAGAELGGVALAAATAMHTGKNWIIVRNSKKGSGNRRRSRSPATAGSGRARNPAQIPQPAIPPRSARPRRSRSVCSR